MNGVSSESCSSPHDLVVWTRALFLEGELATAEPKRLRYRVLHVARPLALSRRRAKLRLRGGLPEEVRDPGSSRCGLILIQRASWSGWRGVTETVGCPVMLRSGDHG